MDGLLAEIAGSVTWESIKFVSLGLKREALGTDQDRAIMRARKDAFLECQKLLAPQSELDKHIFDVYEHIFASQEIASEILEKVLARVPVVASLVRELVAKRSYVPEQLKFSSGLDFDGFVEQYAQFLSTKILSEAKTDKNPISNLVTVSILETLARHAAVRDGRSTEVVRQFVSLYVGDAGRVVPFGGRQRELKCLNDWLASQDAPSRLFMSGPAGSGKSALLVQWMLEVMRDAGRGAINVIFVPISLRFETRTSDAIFTLLAAQLGALYGEAIPSTASPFELRSFAHSLLRKHPLNSKKLLIVVDGLDEGLDLPLGGIFPPNTPSFLKIVASARSLPGDVSCVDWIGRLSWPEPVTFLELTGLSFPAVLELMDGVEVAGLEENVRQKVAKALYRSTGGDPLLLSLWIGSLQDNRIQIKSLDLNALATEPPGLSVLFRALWDAQVREWGVHDTIKRDAAAKQFLAICAVAKGPISSLDFHRISPERFPEKIDVSVTARSLGRIIAGNGDTVGYSFCHPRLADYVRSAFFFSVGSVASSELLEYCKAEFQRWKSDGKCADPPIAGYVVRHLGNHLWEAPEFRPGLKELVSRAWYDAWIEVLGETSGFLADLSKAQVAAEANHDIRTHLTSILMRASIRTQGENLNGELILLAEEYHLITISTAITRARYLLSTRDAANTICKLAHRLPRERQAQAYDDALEIVLQSSDSHVACSVLDNIAPDYKPVVAEHAFTAAAGAFWGHRCSAFGALASRRDIPDKIRLAALTECIETANEHLDRKDGWAGSELPFVVGATQPESEFFFKRALEECARWGGGSANDFLGYSHWSDGRGRKRRRNGKSLRSRKYSTSGLLLLSELAKRCSDAQLERVRKKYLIVVKTFYGTRDFAQAVWYAANFRLSKRQWQTLLNQLDEHRSLLSLDDLLFCLAHCANDVPRQRAATYWADIGKLIQQVDDHSTWKSRALLLLLKARPADHFIQSEFFRAIGKSKRSDPSTQIVEAVPFLANSDKPRMVRTSWEEALLVDDGKEAEACLFSISCAGSQTPDELLEKLERGTSLFLEPDENKRTVSLLKTLALSFCDDMAFLETLAQYALRLTNLGVSDWRDLFGSLVATKPNPTTEIFAQDALPRERVDLLLRRHKAGLIETEEVSRQLLAIVDKVRGLERVAATGFLWARGEIRSERASKVFHNAIDGALESSASNIAAEKLAELAALADSTPIQKVLVSDIRELAKSEESNWRRASCLSRLLEFVCDEERSVIISEILDICEEDRWLADNTLKRAAKWVDPTLMKRTISLVPIYEREGLEAIENVVVRWSQLRPQLADLQQELLFGLFNGLTLCSRKTALNTIRLACPAIVWTVGRSSLQPVEKAIHDARAWWP